MLQILAEGEQGAVDIAVLVANVCPRTVREVCGGVPVTRVASFGSVGTVGLCPTFPLWLRRLAGVPNPPDHDGDPVSALTRDQMLDNVSVYWHTGTAASSGRWPCPARC